MSGILLLIKFSIMFNKKLFLVRHGQTELNKKGVIQGKIDSPLTDKGINQAIETANRAKDLNIDILIASDLGRAVQTAGIISDEIGVSITKTDPSFRERDFGKADILTFTEAAEAYPQFVNEDGIFNLYNDFPESETVKDFYNRVVNSINNLMSEYANKNVMLVTHAGFLRMMYAYINEIAPEEIFIIYAPENCEIFNV